MSSSRGIGEGKLIGDHVLVPDATYASRIYNKGYYGTLQAGETLELELIEAAYLIDANRLTVYKNSTLIQLEDLITIGTKFIDTFEIKFIVYRDLRRRGYVVKSTHKPLDFRVYPRGGVPGKIPSKYWVEAISERAEFRINELIHNVELVRTARKRHLLALVDEEGDITYYRVDPTDPRSQHISPPLSSLLEPDELEQMGDERQSVIKKVKGLLMKDRVIIWDETVAKKLHEHGFYGKLMGNWLQLSLIEAAYLMKENVLSIVDSTTGREIDWDKFMVRTLQVQPDFELRLKVYGELKNRNLIVKTGFKYGAHFRAYKRDPEETHADYLIHGVPDAYEGSWSEVSRAVRLAHGVRKEMIFARVLPKGIDCIKISRIKP